MHVPPVRTDLVARPHLIERLNEGVRSKLTFVSASAGFGKTTLVCEWARQAALPVAWLSLSEEDNYLLRFLTYFIAALQTIQPKVGVQAQALLDSPQPPVESILTDLINELGILSESISLVLEDYHLIESQEIHRYLDFLLEHMPPQLRLLVTSRIELPFSLSRLRVRGELVELHTDDLRFTSDECAAFFDRLLGLHLSAQDLAALEARTEGWIAGLQLAALSMQGNDAQHISEFIRSFTGSDRYVLDYLLEEVFLKQPEDIQTFLLFTSILNHLSGPLCDALVTAGEMGHPSGSASEAKLEYLERANLFTAPLDNKRQWYCYHPLFADFLRHRLMITQANRVPQLHRRASTWFERQGLIEDALRHALAAQDFEMATRLIEQVADRFWARGQILTMLSWLKLIPDDLLCARARLSLNYAWALILTNQLDSAEPVLQSVQSQVLAASTTPEFDPPTPRVEQTPSANGTAWDRSPQGTLAKVATLRAFVARYKGDVPGAISFSQQALDLIPAGQTLTRGMVMLCLGHAQLMSGNIEAAREALSEAGRLGLAARHVDVYLSAMHYLGQLQVLQGELHQAAAIYRQARQFVVEQGEHDYCGIDRIGLGDVLFARGALQDAAEAYQRALAGAQPGDSLAQIAAQKLNLVANAGTVIH